LKFHPLSHFFQLKIFYTAWANEWQFKKLHRHWFCSSCWHPASCQFLSSHVQWVPVIEFQQAKVTCMLAWNWATKMSYFEKPKCMRHLCWWRSFCTSSQVYKSLWIVRIMISRFPQADLLSSQFTAYHWGGVVLMVNFNKSHVKEEVCHALRKINMILCWFMNKSLPTSICWRLNPQVHKSLWFANQYLYNF